MRLFAIVAMVLAIGCSVEAPPPPLPPAEQAAAVARQDAASIRPDTTRSIAEALPMGDVPLPSARTQADVYALLFEIRYHGTAEAGNVVKNQALPMPTLTGSATSWLKEFADVPVALWRAAHRPFPTKAQPFDVAIFPRGTKLVSEQTIQAMFRRGTAENYAAFKQQYGSDGWLSFSEMLFAPDGLDALVYYERRCGGACGEGGYVWAHRDSTQSPWSIKRRIISWMS